MGFELILPFLRPIEHLILDEEISEIMVNGSGRIFIERRGDLTRCSRCPPHGEKSPGCGAEHRPGARRRGQRATAAT